MEREHELIGQTLSLALRTSKTDRCKLDPIFIAIVSGFILVSPSVRCSDNGAYCNQWIGARTRVCSTVCQQLKTVSIRSFS